MPSCFHDRVLNRSVEELVKWVEQEYWAYGSDTSGRIWDMKTRVPGKVIKHKGNTDFCHAPPKKWGTGQGGEKRGRVSGVLSAPSPLLAQEDPWCI
eukprot:4460634-Pyramimonas_sp.AAC.1